MRILLPLLKQDIVNDQLISKEEEVEFDLDTSVYSEERWEQNFPAQAAHEGLFQYIDRIHKADSSSERVKVASMLKAVFCFLEADQVRSYKEFLKMFNLATPEYTTKLVDKLISAFRLVLGASAVKN